jgi:hypothetical protein
MDERGNMLPRSKRIKMLDEAGQLANVLQRHWSQFDLTSANPYTAFVNKDDDDDDGDDSSDGDDDDDDDDSDDDDASKSKKDGKKDKKDDDDDRSASDDDDDDDDMVRLPRGEAERLRRENRDLKKKQRDAEKDARKQREADLADNEKFKELAEERQTRVEELETELEDVKGTIASNERDKKIKKIAKRVGFADPDDARLYLDDETKDKDDKAIERALKDVLEDKTHLKGKRSGSGAPMDDESNGDGGGKDTLSMEDIQGMSQDEINKRWDEVEPVLSKNRKKVADKKD